MTGIIPNASSGGLISGSANVSNNPGVQPTTYTISCGQLGLPNDCTSKITPAQINAIVSELLNLAACFNPTGTWTCSVLDNLCSAFNAYSNGIGVGTLEEDVLRTIQNNDAVFLTDINGTGVAGQESGLLKVLTVASIAPMLRLDATNFVTGFGNGAAQNAAGTNNTAVGQNSGIANSGSFVTSVGDFAAGTNSGDRVSAVGSGSAENNSGDSVTAIGNVTAFQNTYDLVTAIGFSAGNSFTAGTPVAITGFGPNTLTVTAHGFGVAGATVLVVISGTTAPVGLSLGQSYIVTIVDANTVAFSGVTITSAGVAASMIANLAGQTNSTMLGANSAVTGPNQVQLGDSATTTYVFGTVQNRSDMRDKADIENTLLGLNFINALRPVSYRWDLRSDYFDALSSAKGPVIKITKPKDGTKKRVRRHQGLIAQEVLQVATTLGIEFGGVQDHSLSGGGEVMSIGYDELIPPLIKSVQQLSVMANTVNPGMSGLSNLINQLAAAQDVIRQDLASHIAAQTIVNQTVADHIAAQTIVNQTTANHIAAQTIVNQTTANHIAAQVVINQTVAAYMAARP